jgi:hypothetical protein
MAINSLAGFLYGVVRETWMVSAVLVKYLLVANLGLIAYRGEISLEKFSENILDYAKPVLLTVTLLGVVLHISGTSFSPMFRFFSELVALATLGYLFWKY